MQVKKLFKDYSLNTYTRIGPVFERGRGSWLWDARGRRYIDLFPGWGVSILGHCHKRIAAAVSHQARRLIHLPNNLFFPEQAVLAQRIIKESFPGRVFFGNSGAEAVEGAVKLSRLYGCGKRHEVITMKDSFHGRTFAALSATGQSKYKAPFKPVLPLFKESRLNDLADLKKKYSSKTVAVMLELIQGEGGVNISRKQYIKDLYKFCREKDILFIVDEVQTGMGRTGKLFAYQHYGIKPDIMLLSKGLGAGVAISAIVAAKRIEGIIKPGMHASTFGGSPLVTRVSLEVFDVIKDEHLLSHTRRMGAYLKKRLDQFKDRFSFIKEVRALGLMTGVELTIDSFPIFAKAFERGLIINSTHQNVLRIMPALNVKKQELDYGLKILEGVLKEVR